MEKSVSQLVGEWLLQSEHCASQLQPMHFKRCSFWNAALILWCLMQCNIHSSHGDIGSSVTYSLGFTANHLNLAAFEFIRLDWAATSILTRTWPALKMYVLSQMNGRTLGWYYRGGRAQFIWALSTHAVDLLFSLAGYCSDCFVWVTTELWIDHVTIGQAYPAPGVKPFDVLKSVIRYAISYKSQ